MFTVLLRMLGKPGKGKRRGRGDADEGSNQVGSEASFHLELCDVHYGDAGEGVSK
jgi:hypothetical protein